MGYSQKFVKSPLNMQIDLTEKHETEHKLKTFTLTEETSLLLHTQKLTQLPSKLELEAKGTGCAVVQSVLRYNVKETLGNNGFQISAREGNNEDYPSLWVCAQYTGPRKDWNGIDRSRDCN